MIQTERTSLLNTKYPNPNGTYVIYWMQQAQRASWNHALEYAIDKANEFQKPLIVLFTLFTSYPNANLRHYDFMLKGLHETQGAVKKRNIGFHFLTVQSTPTTELTRWASQAVMIVTDRGYLHFQEQWRHSIARKIPCSMICVDTDTIVPVHLTSTKAEYAASTIRPKINRLKDRFLVHLAPRTIDISCPSHFSNPIPNDVISSIQHRHNTVAPIQWLKPGYTAARKRLINFLQYACDYYDTNRNDPSLDGQSGLSPYIHFGQISVLEIALEALKLRSNGTESFLEELIVRRELALNFTCFTQPYLSPEHLPDWVKKTLREHEKDPRPYHYTFQDFRDAYTHDPYWNAAQKELLTKGKMHGYMRMYWGKKILEWSNTVDEAYETALVLNDTYSLDDRDPNGYAGVAWCFGKHDRPWSERPIFGKVRYMNDKGLKRKFDIETYVTTINNLLS